MHFSYGHYRASHQLLTTSIDLDDSQKRAKVTDLERDIALVWNSMTPAEKEVATEDVMNDLEEHCKNKVLATHNIPISSFHDSRVTLDAMTREVCSPPFIQEQLVDDSVVQPFCSYRTEDHSYFCSW